MKQLFTTFLVSLFFVSSYSLTITGDEIWTTDRTINETLVIEPGAKLTISGCTIKVAENVNIYLYAQSSTKAGGELILDNAVITSSGNNMWRELKLFNGTSLTMNNATIKNSLYGVGNSGGSCTVKIQNSTFIDCNRPLRLDITDFQGTGSYIRNNTVYTGTAVGFQFVHAKNLTLEANTFYSDYTNMGYQIFFTNCQGITLKDNYFICLNNNNYTTDACGIRIDNSRINFVSSAYYIKNTFEGFSTAIDIYNLRDNNNALIINDIDFNKIRRYGIRYDNQTSASGSITVYNNMFRMFTNNAIGIYFKNLHNYYIYKNQLIGSDINNYNSGLDIESPVLINSSQLISSNRFANLHYGISLKGYHHHAEIKCNAFAYDYYSILVNKYEEYDNNQGLGDQGTINGSASNEFYKHGENRSLICNNGKRFTYYYPQMENLYPNLCAKTVTLESAPLMSCNDLYGSPENISRTAIIEEEQSSEYLMRITPNPGYGTITISLSDSVIKREGEKTIRIYNTSGMLVHTQVVAGNNPTLWIDKAFLKGNYKCILSDNHGVITYATAIVK